MRQYGLNFYLQPVRLFSYWRWYLADYSEGDVVYLKCDVEELQILDDRGFVARRADGDVEGNRGIVSFASDYWQIINNLGFNVAFGSTRSILPVDTLS